MDKNVSAIVAMANGGEIGKNGGLLCHLSADLKHFKTTTMGHAIIMGRKTFESFPKGALPGRQNIVISRNKDFCPEGVTVAGSLDEALEKVEMSGEVFIIGGAQIYEQAIARVHTLYVTYIHADFPDADAYFPPIDDEDWLTVEIEHHRPDEKNPLPYSFAKLIRNSHCQ